LVGIPKLTAAENKLIAYAAEGEEAVFLAKGQPIPPSESEASQQRSWLTSKDSMLTPERRKCNRGFFGGNPTVMPQ